MADMSSYFSTLFVLVGGDDVFSADEFEAVFAPVLTQSFKAFDHATCDYMAPQYARDVQPADPDTGETFTGYNVVGGALDGYPVLTMDGNPAAPPYISGLVWHLYNKTRPPDLAGVRSQLRGSPAQMIMDAGYQMLQLSLVPYGSLTVSSGYRNWPAMPPLPAMPGTPTQTTSSSGPSPWWLLLGLVPLLGRKHYR
jgi:hypothetical protein